MKQYLLLILLFCTATIYSQNSSSINGKLIDKEYNNEPLAFGTVSIKGTVQETSADIDGTYVFENLKPGKYVLVYSFVGYKTKEKTVNVTADKNPEINVEMEARRHSIESMANTTTEKTESTELKSS